MNLSSHVPMFHLSQTFVPSSISQQPLNLITISVAEGLFENLHHDLQPALKIQARVSSRVVSKDQSSLWNPEHVRRHKVASMLRLLRTRTGIDIRSLRFRKARRSANVGIGLESGGV